MSIFSAVGGFISETQAELKKVIWPSRKETMRLTVIVIAVSVAVTIFIMLLDYVFSKLVNIVI